MTTVDHFGEYLAAKRGLAVLHDRAASGQLNGDEYTAEWKRLAAMRDESATHLTLDQRRAAHEQAKYAC